MHGTGAGGSDNSKRAVSVSDALMAISMAFGRGTAAHLVATAAELDTSDRVVDVGCGTGTALRVASKRCEWAIGVDPSPASVHLCRRLNHLHHRENATVILGRAEALPLPDGSATVAWSLSSFHHWTNPGRGLEEAMRVLQPNGRVLVVERLVKPGARGHAVHGLSATQLEDVVGALVAAGFTDVIEIRRPARRTTWSIISARRPST